VRANKTERHTISTHNYQDRAVSSTSTNLHTDIHALTASAALDRMFRGATAPLTTRRNLSRSAPCEYDALLDPKKMGFEVSAREVFAYANSIGCVRALVRLVLLESTTLIGSDKQLTRLRLCLSDAGACEYFETDSMLPEFLSNALRAAEVAPRRMAIRFGRQFPTDADGEQRLLSAWQAIGIAVEFDTPSTNPELHEIQDLQEHHLTGQRQGSKRADRARSNL
jgi:hypothetical protein